MTRIIHTGDTHLGYQQYHRPERRADFLDAFRAVIDDATDGGVDAVVHAGDLFHDRRPTLPDIMGALSGLRTLDDAGIPFLAVVGNHEAKRDAQWLDLFESLGLATRLGSEPVTVGNTAFYGLDFVPRASRDDLEYEFEPHDAEYAALVAHGLFEPFPHGDWDAREVLAESTVDFDAVLLGDDHTPRTRQVEEPHGAWLTYSGSTERTSAEEREGRGYNLVDFPEDSGRVDIRRRGLDTREFVFVDVELAPGEGIERVRERVGQHDVTDAVVVVSITGEGDPVTPATVEEYADEQGTLVTRVSDHRELAEESELDVSFADPDEAVRQRVRELGLSPAARDLDEIIRASKVADANVADAVEDRVREFVAEADAGAFAPVDPDESARSGDDDTQSADAETQPANADAQPADAEAQLTDNDTQPTDAEAQSADADRETADRDGSGDAQVTMEDYL